MATYTLTFNYPNGMGVRLLNSFCLGANYEQFKLAGESQTDFLSRALKQFVRERIVRGEIEAASQLASNQAAEAVANELPIT